MVPGRLWYCTDSFVRGCQFSCTGPASCQADLQWGAAGWGEWYMCCLAGMLLMTPQKATLDSLRCVHFRDSYPIDVAHLNFNILCVCCYSRYLSLWAYRSRWVSTIKIWIRVHSTSARWYIGFASCILYNVHGGRMHKLHHCTCHLIVKGTGSPDDYIFEGLL